MQGITPQGLIRKDIAMVTEKDFSQPPPKGYLKYNIDGASKGNLGTAGFGGVLRDEEGSIIVIFHSHLGRATNNMAELMALEQCLEFLTQNHGSNVIIEADSEITINSVKRINYGTRQEKVSNHWKLIQVYQRIQVHLEGLRTLSFNHVRRTANKLADSLANQGVNNADCGMAKKWQEIPQNRLKFLCEEQATKDREVVRYRARMTSMNWFFWQEPLQPISMYLAGGQAKLCLILSRSQLNGVPSFSDGNLLGHFPNMHSMGFRFRSRNRQNARLVFPVAGIFPISAFGLENHAPVGFSEIARCLSGLWFCSFGSDPIGITTRGRVVDLETALDRTLSFRRVRLRDMIPGRWIQQRGSTVWIEHVGLWGEMGYIYSSCLARLFPLPWRVGIAQVGVTVVVCGLRGVCFSGTSLVVGCSCCLPVFVSH